MRNKKIKTIKYQLLVLAMFLFSFEIAMAGNTGGSVSTGAETGPTGTAVTAPVASLAAGSYSSSQSVNLTATDAPYMCYTTNNVTPSCNWVDATCSNSTKYSGAISVSSSLTLKAVACYQGAEKSGMSSYSYTISTGGGGGGGGFGVTDTTPPANASLLINNGAETTNSIIVELTIGAEGADYMAISNNESFEDTSWIVYQTTKFFILTIGDEEKTIYVKFKDSAGNESEVISQNINLVNGAPAPQVLGVKIEGDVETERAAQLAQILTEAGYIHPGDAATAASKMGLARSTADEQAAYERYTVSLIADVSGLEQSNINAITNFVLYGTPSTRILGAGERAGVVNSYKAAFGKLPTTEAEWQDVIKIANGRWPNETSQVAEDRAKVSFRSVYLRDADMDNPNDNAAVTIMAYGLRSDNRNLESEKTAILSFEYIFNYSPSSATDWDIVRAIAYSGATR